MVFWWQKNHWILLSILNKYARDLTLDTFEWIVPFGMYYTRHPKGNLDFRNFRKNCRKNKNFSHPLAFAPQIVYNTTIEL